MESMKEEELRAVSPLLRGPRSLHTSQLHVCLTHRPDLKWLITSCSSGLRLDLILIVRVQAFSHLLLTSNPKTSGKKCNFNLGGSGQRIPLPHYHSCPSYTIIPPPRCKITPNTSPAQQDKSLRSSVQTRLRPTTLGCSENEDGCGFISKNHLSIQLQKEQFQRDSSHLIERQNVNG